MAYQDSTFYHVAPRSLREDIARYGFCLDAISERNHNWCDRGLYLWDAEEWTQWWARALHFSGITGPVDIWVVVVPEDVDVYPDSYREFRPHKERYQHSYCVIEDLGPECFALLEDRAAAA